MFAISKQWQQFKFHEAIFSPMLKHGFAWKCHEIEKKNSIFISNKIIMKMKSKIENEFPIAII